MRKTLGFLIVLVAFLAIFFISTNVQAYSDVAVEKIEVTSPKSGTYTTGQKITIVATFSGKITGTKEAAPTLKIKFGVNTHYIYGETISGKTVTYTYTIDEYDSGTLEIEDITGGYLKDEDGQTIYPEMPSSVTGSTIKVNPIKWTDASKAKITINDNYQLKISGITEISGHRYCVYFTRNNKEPEFKLDSYGWPENADYVNVWEISFSKYLELSGDLYVWIYEAQRNNETGKVENKLMVDQKLDRPAQKPLGTRMSAYFFDDGTSTFLWEPYNYDNTRKLKIKIGKVTDESILRSIQKGEAGCLSKLLTYAKSASSLYTTTLKLGKDKSITSKFNLVDKEYYYVYVQLDDENGKYYPVEDVSLYQGLVGETAGKNLFNYLDDQFVWNLSEEDYFSDFSKAKAVVAESDVVASRKDITKNTLKIKVSNVVSKLGKEHKFFYYVSNSKEDLPKANSDLWTVADKVNINKETGACTITTGNICKLPYADKLNLSKTLYIFVYEVVSDSEIKSDTISGEYKLGLNAKLVTAKEETTKKPTNNTTKNTVTNTEKDNTILTGTKLPQTGEKLGFAVLIIVTIGLTIYFARKYRKYNF